MPPSQGVTRLRVVVIGLRDRAENCRLEMLENDFNLSFLGAADYKELGSKLAATVPRQGLIEACIILADTAQIQPFGKELLQLLLRSCRVVVSVSPGRRTPAFERMTCDIPATRPEAAIKMAVYLILGSVEASFYTETCPRAQEWKAVTVPDCPDMVLGVVGMGNIGKCLAEKAALSKTRVKYFDCRRLSIDEEAAYQAWYCHSLQELLSESDVVCHCELTDEGENAAPGDSGPRREAHVPARLQAVS